MNNRNIQTKVLLVTLLPLSLTALLLSSFFIWNKISDIDAALDTKGQSLANLLAPACEYGVLSGNKATLTRLIQASARDRDVMDIRVTDAHSELIAHTATPDGRPGEAALLKNFQAPIFYTSLTVDDFETTPTSGSGTELVPEVIGTVRVTLTREHAIARQTEAVINGLLITAIMVKAAKDGGAEGIEVSPQLETRGFYEKLGFRAVGDTYMDARIEHVRMALWGE